MTRMLVEKWPRVLPGKDPVYVRPEVAKRLRRAEQVHGGPIYPTGSKSGGRTYAQQKALRDDYLAGKGPVASDPDIGPRPHMKFIAFDVAPASYGALEAMKQVGFDFTTPGEKWHAEEPDARGWPVVTSFYTAEESAPTLPEEEDDMTVRTIRYTGRTPAWAICSKTLPGGFIRTSDGERAKALAALHVPNWGSGPRDGWDYETNSSTEFNAILAEAGIDHEGYVETLRKAFTGGSSGTVPTSFEGTFVATANS